MASGIERRRKFPASWPSVSLLCEAVVNDPRSPGWRGPHSVHPLSWMEPLPPLLDSRRIGDPGEIMTGPSRIGPLGGPVYRDSRPSWKGASMVIRAASFVPVALTACFVVFVAGPAPVYGDGFRVLDQGANATAQGAAFSA